MIAQIFSHALLAITIWLITVIILKKKDKKSQLPVRITKKMELCRQLQFMYSYEEIESKRKRKNRQKKKEKKVAFAETVQGRQKVMGEERKDLGAAEEQSQKKGSKHKQIQLIRVEMGQSNENNHSAENDPQLKQKDESIKSQTQAKSKNEQKAEQNSVQQLPKRSQFVFAEIQLMRSYFLQDFQQILHYNGRYGQYRLNLQGSSKSLTIEWHYHAQYPKQLIEISINKQALNPLQLQKIQSIIKLQKERFVAQPEYMYIFNLTTSIYQDLLLVINFSMDEDKVEKTAAKVMQIKTQSQPHIDLTKQLTDPRDIKAKKEIYGKILDEIFYLHDMIQKPDVSTMMKNQTQETLKVKQPGSRGRYWAQFQQLELIGEGGFGRVYRVRHKLDGNIYAIKKAIVNYQDLNDRKILKEVALLSKLNHPNIVRYYQSWLEDATCMEEIISDMEYSESEVSKIEELNHIMNRWRHARSGDIAFQTGSQGSYHGSVVQNSGIVFQDDDSDIAFEDGGEAMELSNKSSISQAGNENQSERSSSVMNNLEIFPFKILYIAMQFCNGINLREFINARFEQQEQKIQILRGILEGLAYIHQKKIIHRDLKPANIFLTESNKVKIGDFGLATYEDRSMSISQESYEFDPFSDKTQAVGTGFYRAPQQLKSNKYDEKVDIYSLGIIMLELFHHFRTIMERADVLKEVTQSQRLPKEFMVERAGTDILESILNSLNENPKKRPSAHQLLQNFRNKYFSQLVSCIANPKHFQFSQLLNQLFDIKNEAVTPLMLRDNYKSYITSKIQKIYHIHKATLFPALPLIPVQDFQTLNNHKIKTNRNNKYLLITNRGVVLQYASNSLKTWLKYAKQDFKRKRMQSLEEQRSSLRRYTFEKVVQWQKPRDKQDLCYRQKMITAFDLAYKAEEGFNVFYFCQILKISEAIVLTLNLTQKTPPIYMFHSQLYQLIAQKYHLQKEKFYSALLAIDEEEFNPAPLSKKISYFQQKNLPLHFAKKFCNIMDKQFDDPYQLLNQLQLNNQNELLAQIQDEIQEILTVRERIKGKNKLKWKMLIPQAHTNGYFWQIGLIKGLSSLQEYAIGQEFYNHHIQLALDFAKETVDVSIWCIGQYLEQEMQKIILQCWQNGLSTRWYDWQIGQREDLGSRYSIILRRKNERVHVMVRNNEERGSKEEKASFFGFEHFNCDVIKLNNTNHYH